MKLLERRLAGLLWRLLVWRGWVVRMNPPELCHDVYEIGSRRYDLGWPTPSSVRYGHQAIYLGPGPVRWKGARPEVGAKLEEIDSLLGRSPDDN